MLGELILIMIVMAVGDSLATLKTIFVARRIMEPVYIVVFINAVIFIMVVSRVVENEEGFYYAVAFAVGKTLGVFLGSLIDKKMALGLLEVSVFFNRNEKMVSIADDLRELGYSVNTYDVQGFRGRKRYIVEVLIRRKWLNQLKQVLREKNGKEPTMYVKEISNVYGKLRDYI